ncbi:MAG: ABC transporter ATP-binding protein [Spirochaetaceae bacterium]|jgi:oligopeptide/dipeptide ABC transporter ATP-binding protein|nr:ABC transporter ATP-binding protein [Spirochaetaceae bacterium]
MAKTLLGVKELQVQFRREDGVALGVKDVSFSVTEGVNLALVGESGCGKSVTSLSCMRLLGNNGKISKGAITFEGQDITCAEEKEMEKLRGERMSMIFQEPMTSLNPVLTIKYQLSEALRLHTDMTKKEISARCVQLLRQVGIADVEKALAGYPHELSGGMRQRVMIAMALACKPRLLIADEPTTALDVTIQAQILSLLKKLQQETGITIMIITHDFGVVAEMADEVVVMYAGYTVEQGTVEELFTNPLHPYTKGLLKSIISLEAGANRPLYSIPGIVPAMNFDWKGCPFEDRCSYRMPRCGREFPAMRERTRGHSARCFAGEDQA